MEDELEELDKMFENLLKRFPEKKKELMEDVGEKMYKQVMENIETKVESKSKNKEKDNLKKDVQKVFGSGEGYVAIKPAHENSKLSYLVENGHRIVRNGVTIGFANGKHMYRNAIDQVADEIEKMAEQMVDELVGEFDD